MQVQQALHLELEGGEQGDGVEMHSRFTFLVGKLDLMIASS